MGRSLIEASAKNVLKTSMELGGNAPFLIFDDADLDAAVDGALLAKMRNIGEACTSANRFHVAEPVREEFQRRLAEKMGALKIGRGTEEDVKVGPLIDQPSREKVAELVQDALDKGPPAWSAARSPTGAATSTRRPCWATCPTTPACSTRRSSARWHRWRRSSPRRTRSRANDTEYGLVAYVFTRDIKRAIRVCEGLETGMVGLNQGMVSNAGAPFGGVKQSGIGREGGHEGLEEFLETKYVAVNL